MSDFPLISVIVPVYNVEPYLRQCLDSILNQSYSNIEIIIIASTSDDNSCDICMDYERKDSRVKVVHSEPQGLSAARNLGLAVSNGIFVSFIDSDDFVNPDFISVLYGIIDEFECDIAQCDYCDVVESNCELHVICDSEITVYSGLDMCYNIYNPKYSTQSIVSWSKLYKMELFRSINFPFGKIHEDEATSYRLFFKSQRVGLTQQKLYYYRQRSDSIMGQRFSLKNLDFLNALSDRLYFFKRAGETELYGMTLKVYSEVFPTYLYNVKNLCGRDNSIVSSLYNDYLQLRRDALRCHELSICDKIHMILVWLYPRTPCTVKLLDIIHKLM